MRRDVARLFDAMADSYERLEPWYEHLYARVHGILRAELRPAAAAVAPRALDAGCGTGFQAAILEDLGWRVHGVDIAGRLLVRARTHLRAPALALATLEALPYRAATFDAVVSIYGVMFAPDHRLAASELARVCRPGGRIALACWTPGGFIGETFRLFSRFLPPTPGLQPPVVWGDEAYQRELFRDSAKSLTAYPRTAIFRYRSAIENVEFFRTYYGPTLRAFESLPAERQAALNDELIALIQRYDRNAGTGPVAIVADYLETVIVRK